MTTSLRKLVFIVLLTGGGPEKAKAQDTAALIKDFSQIMSFAVQPHVYYTSITTLKSTPLLNEADNMILPGSFYKNGTNFYFGNPEEEMYLEDSFMVRVNHKKKTVWISIADEGAKSKMNVMPLDNKAVAELFRKQFIISKSAMDNESARLNFEAVQYFDSVSTVLVKIGLQYTGKNMLPQLLEMNVSMKQHVDADGIAEMEAQGVDTKKVVQFIGTDHFIIREQYMSVKFEDIDFTITKASQMPSWKNKLLYDDVKKDFFPKGNISDYEVTKMF